MNTDSKLKHEIGAYVRYNRGPELESNASYGYIIGIFSSKDILYCKTRWLGYVNTITSPEEKDLIVIAPSSRLTKLIFL